MADHMHSDHTDRTYVRETDRPAARSGNATMAFVVGGLVVLVAIIAFVLWGGADEDVAAPPLADGDNVSVTVEGEEATAPVVDEVAPAPAEESAAPATDDAEEEVPVPAE